MVELSIDSLAFGGAGVGRHQGKAVFVPFTAPGDRARVRITKNKARFAEGALVDLIAPGPGRRSAPCPVFGSCGGCQWQHLPYDEQCRWKEAIFADSLQRHCGLTPEQLRPMQAAPCEWNYRSRVQFKCRQDHDRFAMGFYRRGSHVVVDIQQCPIIEPSLNAALARLRPWLAQSPCPECISGVDMAVDDEGRVRILVHVLKGAQGAVADYLEQPASSTGFSLFVQSGKKGSTRQVCGVEELHIHPLEGSGLRLAYGPGGFAQVNLAQNRRLVHDLVEAAQLTGSERVLDLYCGMGNFSLPLARGAQSLVGVEEYSPAIQKAQANATVNGLRQKTKFLAQSAEGAARALWSGQGFDLVVLDPPRAGAFQVVKELCELRPMRILYVSCDPQTLARDLVPLIHGGYRLEWARAYDLFPQTYHTESLALLTRIE